MTKKVELPFYGFYGLDDTPFRYFFLQEGAQNREQYRQDIIKVLKYQVLHDIFPDHKSGNSTYDSDHLNLRGNTQKVQLSPNKVALFYDESIQGIRGGELIVTYELDENKKDIKLNLYDRNTKVELVDTKNGPAQYAVCDCITQSQLTIKKGKKIHSKDINICSDISNNMLEGKIYTYDEAIKVFDEVKANLNNKIDDPRNHTTEDKKNQKTSEVKK